MLGTGTQGKRGDTSCEGPGLPGGCRDGLGEEGRRHTVTFFLSNSHTHCALALPLRFLFILTCSHHDIVLR